MLVGMNKSISQNGIWVLGERTRDHVTGPPAEMTSPIGSLCASLNPSHFQETALASTLDGT